MIRARTEQDPRRQDHHNLSRTDDLVRPLYRIGAQLAEPPRFHRGISRAQARQRILALLRLVGIPRPSAASTAIRTSYWAGGANV